MVIESDRGRSRRAVLTAAFAASAAALAGAIARPGETIAANGETVLVGGSYIATAVTKFDTGSSGATALRGDGATGGGVQGTSDSNVGVIGTSYSGLGVYGGSTVNAGTFGYTYAALRPGVLGVSIGGGTGVQGFSGPYATEPAAVGDTGLYGYAAADSGAVGARGESPMGSGVVGFSGSGSLSSRPQTGVYGQANHGTIGIGVRGHSGGGTGGYFSSTTGTSLRATGRVRFDRCAGVATIPVGANSVAVTPGIDLVSTSAVVATLMGSAGGTTNVHRVAVNATTNVFTVYLTANNSAASPVKVAWHVFG